jgi:hypothetical protein
MNDGRDLEREDLEAALAVRRELGRDYEPALVDAFVERVERAIEMRVDARIFAQQAQARRDRRRDGMQLTLGIVSLTLGIPLTTIAGMVADLPGMVTAWAGIAGVNLAYALQRREAPTRRRD